MPQNIFFNVFENILNSEIFPFAPLRLPCLSFQTNHNLVLRKLFLVHPIYWSLLRSDQSLYCTVLPQVCYQS